MMWDNVIAAVKLLIEDDVVLTEIFGEGNFRAAGSSEFQAPMIEWTLLGDTENELWAPMLVQFDLWTVEAADNRRAERRLRGMLQMPTSIALDGYTMFSEYDGGGELATPNRAGYSGRAVRFRFTPLRQQYALSG